MTRTAYPDNPIMAGAWYAAVKWAASEKDALEAFEKATGIKPVFAETRSPIAKMIDHATGYEDASVTAFVDWFNEHVWGEDPFEGGAA
jgi:hypothetical protein